MHTNKTEIVTNVHKGSLYTITLIIYCIYTNHKGECYFVKHQEKRVYITFSFILGFFPFGLHNTLLELFNVI